MKLRAILQTGVVPPPRMLEVEFLPTSSWVVAKGDLGELLPDVAEEDWKAVTSAYVMVGSTLMTLQRLIEDAGANAGTQAAPLGPAETKLLGNAALIVQNAQLRLEAAVKATPKRRRLFSGS